MAITIDLAGQVVLVTGGTKGVGRGIAQRLADAGASVAVCSRSEPEAALPDGWEWFGVDLRDGDAAWAMVDQVVERLGRLDVLVNNAGGAPPADSTTAKPRFTERIIALNLFAAIFCSQRANHWMQQQDDRRLDRQHRQRERAASHAADRGVRRGQGRARELHPDDRGRVGAQGAGEPRHRGHGAHRAVAPLLRRRRRASPRSA